MAYDDSATSWLSRPQFCRFAYDCVQIRKPHFYVRREWYGFYDRTKMPPLARGRRIIELRQADGALPRYAATSRHSCSTMPFSCSDSCQRSVMSSPSAPVMAYGAGPSSQVNDSVSSAAARARQLCMP